MKKILVIALVGINVVLLVALVFVSSASPARAQVIGRGTDYILVTGRVTQQAEAVYIIDLAKQRMVALRWSTGKSPRLIQCPGIMRLDKDFEPEPVAPPGRRRR